MKSTRHILLLAFAIGLLVGAARWVFECLFVVPLMPDPQSSIWIMMSTITSAVVAVMILPFASVALYGLASPSKLMRGAAFVPFLLIIGWLSLGFVNLASMRSALLDSAAPSTPAERLRVLANFTGGPGYEIDNRVAKHPNTPPDVLRSLHGRPDQVGTEIILASNANTPDDVLFDLAKRDDEWAKYILEALKENPRYGVLFSGNENTPSQ
jgi:hypothetical protein